MEHIELNRSERTYLALEGVAGSLTQVYAVRFGVPVGADAVRVALRAVVAAHPRLRAVVERTLLGHRLAVHDDARTIDALFEQAFREEPTQPTDDEALLGPMSRLLSETFAVERDLPIKARFYPHPERPAVLLSIHHIAGDGRSVMGWIGALQRALHGEALAPVAADPPGHRGAILPPSLSSVPAALLEELRDLRRPRGPAGPQLRLPRQPIEGFGPTAMALRRVAPPAKALVAAARSRGTTVGSLVFGAAVTALHRLVPGEGDEIIRTRLSIDLRDLFAEGRAPGDGNYVASFVVDVDPRLPTDAMLQAIDASTRAEIERYKRRALIMTSLGREASSWLGRHHTSRLILGAKRRGRHALQTFHLSNLGRVDALNVGAVPIECVLPSLSHPDVLLGAVSMGGRMLINLVYPSAEVSGELARALITETDRVLGELSGVETAAQPSALHAAG